MNKTIITILLLQLTIFANAQYQTRTNAKGTGFYMNPVFAGDYPDPSILRDGEDYYMVHSSFEYYPGLLIWHSKDLMNWNPVTNALYKYVGSVWAPDLVKHKNKYYIYFPANGTNYVVTADSINGKWSDPVDLKIANIDPGHVVDENGKRYLFFSSGGFVPLSDDGLSVAGAFKSSYGGWQIPREWSIECFCMEGPKLVKRGDYYYLTVAEGGTAGPATGHMVISARSKSLFGPWENSPYNPIIRTTKNSERWWSKGHGTLFEDAKGKWWMVFHAYEKGFYNMGRQTLLQPVEWTKDGWYKIPGGIVADQPIKKPNLITSHSNFTLSDRFDGNNLKPQWKFFGAYDTSRFHFVDNSLAIKAKGNSIANSSPLLCVPSDHSYTAEVELVIEGKATGGLVLFYNERASSGILTNNGNILANINGWQFPTEKNVVTNHLFLRLKNMNNTVDLFYSTDGTKWNKIENSLDISGFHHNAFGGFLGVRIGLCSMGEGVI
ncbi:family 43 glycosylhydrolase [Chitinophagaceae bacterium LB-8]|uniref:Family 43 glycosylhydrolase n=1 Tax=Paraflavisolibacter caeni TaxID=2982496 RepID=A0A9X2XPS9_9BACT|nr:family 43 glycosylhydrolase [Paraflavisolibacter caeni]MCU7552103.1 family 43 glycosylhydrolase [Paraflavisolibacter caeni]